MIATPLEWSYNSLISANLRIFGGICAKHFRGAVICYCTLWLWMKKPSAFFVIFNFLTCLTAFLLWAWHR